MNHTLKVLTSFHSLPVEPWWQLKSRHQHCRYWKLGGINSSVRNQQSETVIGLETHIFNFFYYLHNSFSCLCINGKLIPKGNWWLNPPRRVSTIDFSFGVFFSLFPTLTIHRVIQVKQRLNGEISMEFHFEFKSHQKRKTRGGQ